MSHLGVLLEGFQAFRDRYRKNDDRMNDLSRKAADTNVFVIHSIETGSGSGMLFDTEPGTMFGTRVLGAIVPPYDPDVGCCNLRASLAYAIEVQKIEHVVVLGHVGCAAMSMLVNKTKNKDILSWLHAAEPALVKAKAMVGTDDNDALCRETERQAVIMSMRNLMTYPVVQRAVKAGNLRLHGWMFDMARGTVLDYNLDTRYFEPLVGIDLDVADMVSAERDTKAAATVKRDKATG